MDTPFDPNAAAMHDGIFGLPCEAADARVRLFGVPYEATCSYRRGTADAPGAIRAASRQVDLLDPHFGMVWQVGIHMDELDPRLAELGFRGSELARPVIEAGGPATAELARAAIAVDEISARRSEIVERWTRDRLREGRRPGIVGGDHSCPLGAIRAAAAGGALSILHIDAHLDLRRAYEGFRESHASIMDNVLDQCPGVSRLVSIGIRDFCAEEQERALAAGDRIRVYCWHDWCRRALRGAPFQVFVDEVLACLGERVWVSFDIDGLDPALCPQTGTPVPGGLDFDEMAHLVWSLGASGREVIGFDLCEVGSGDWDADVGARVLYKLCGLAGGGHA